MYRGLYTAFIDQSVIQSELPEFTLFSQKFPIKKWVSRRRNKTMFKTYVQAICDISGKYVHYFAVRCLFGKWEDNWIRVNEKTYAEQICFMFLHHMRPITTLIWTVLLVKLYSMCDVVFLCQLEAFKIQNLQRTRVESLYSSTDHTTPVLFRRASASNGERIWHRSGFLCPCTKSEGVHLI